MTLARVFVRLRHLVVLFWIAFTVWIGLTLPGIPAGGGGSLQSLVPSHASSIRAQEISSRRFAFPLITRTVVVVRNPHGLSLVRQFELTDLGVRLALHQVSGFSQIAAAVPLTNELGVLPFTREHGTTELLYLYFQPSVSFGARASAAERLVRQVIGHRRGEYEGVTGVAPAEVAQGNLINARLDWVAIATILLVALIVGYHFRAVPAAVLTVGSLVVSYVVANRLDGQIVRLIGGSVGGAVQPVIVVLVFGVITDYSIFFMSRFRSLLAAGETRREAAADVTHRIAPIVFAAGFTVAAGTGALMASTLGFLRQFGPAMAVAVLVTMCVAVTLVPAVLAIAGRGLFWPRPPEPAHEPVEEAEGGGGLGGRARRLAIGFSTRFPLVAVVVVVALVVVAGSGLIRINLGDELIRSLPAGSQARVAFDQAALGFQAGAVEPGTIVVTGQDLRHRLGALAALQGRLGAQPDMATVLGPGNALLAQAGGVAVARDGSAARYMFFTRSPPLGPRATNAVRTLGARLPALLRSVGLRRARALIGGDTALSVNIIEGIDHSLVRVTPAVLAAIFVVMAAFLWTFLVPGLLVFTSALAAVASLGLTVYVMELALGYGVITYYAAFTVGVLLVSLGSDYNVFLAGRIWQESRVRPLREAVRVGGLRASRPIATAGFVLALSFALLAIIPIHAFREIAFGMFAGLIIDAFVIRTLLAPALITLAGRRRKRVQGPLAETGD